jgi:hypothetical protein
VRQHGPRPARRQIVGREPVSRRATQRRTALIALGAVIVVVGLIAGAGEGVLMLAPALLLAAVLGTGRYVGEDAIARVRRAAPPRRRVARAAALVPASHRVTRRITPRGGLLLAASLATRPPPLG